MTLEFNNSFDLPPKSISKNSIFLLIESFIIRHQGSHINHLIIFDMFAQNHRIGDLQHIFSNHHQIFINPNAYSSSNNSFFYIFKEMLKDFIHKFSFVAIIASKSNHKHPQMKDGQIMPIMEIFFQSQR